MKTAVLAITPRGAELAIKISKSLGADIYLKEEIAEKYICDSIPYIYPIKEDFLSFSGEVFNRYRELVFIMAAGIVTRAIAPYIKDKSNDPAVVVSDEKGRWAISLLSGHIGGANELADKVASITGGTPVITTATDINGVIAFDMFAKRNDCIIENIPELKYISFHLVNRGSVYFYTDCKVEGEFPGNVHICDTVNIPGYGVIVSNKKYNVPGIGKVIYIRPRNLIIGIGCKKGTSSEEIEFAVQDFMEKNGRSLLSLSKMVTIDIKKDEGGIINYCSKRKIELAIIPRDEIKGVEHRFSYSDFVKETVGVGNVAEACSVLGGEKAALVCPKTVYKGITLALAEEERVLYI